MKHATVILLFLLLSVWENTNVHAQQTGVEWLTTREGLSQGYISCLLQDSEGFLWAGTKNGLNRYDGYRFEVFTHDPYDPRTLANDYVTGLAEHGAYLILGTNAGLSLFHKNTRFVYRIPPESLLPGMVEAPVHSIVVDADGNIWARVYSPDQHCYLYKISFPEGFWQKPPQDKGWWKTLHVQTWPNPIPFTPLQISPDHKTLYQVSEGKLFQVNTHAGTWTEWQKPLGLQLESLYRDAQGNLWVNAVRKGQRELNRLNTGNAQFERIPVPPFFERLNALTGQLLWLQCKGEINAYRLDTNGQFNPNHPECAPIPASQGINVYLTDRSGLHWMGTNGQGILKINLRSRHFQHLFAGQSICRQILQDKQGNVLTSSYGRNLLQFPEPLLPPVSAFLPLLYSLTNSRMVMDPVGNYWALGGEAGTQNLFLGKMEPGGRYRKIAVPESAFWQNALALDQQGLPWLGVNGHLLRFNPAAETFSNYDFHAVLSEQHTVHAMTQMAEGVWWIATNKGLVRAKPTTQGFDFQLFKNNSNDRNSLHNNDVLALLPDPADPAILWIGTNGGGLDCLDTRSLQFTHLSTSEGLPNAVIYAVLSDENQHLWLSSNKGLIRYTPATRQIKNYTKEDGLQDNEFNTWAYGKGPDGSLLFGGVNGVNRFQPRDLEENTVVPSIHIHGLQLNNQLAGWAEPGQVLQQAIEFSREISVPFSKNNITLEFVALDFSVPNKNRFRYYLEGAESEWVHESAEHRASYLNLSPGTYTFRVKGCNSDGAWNETPAELKIRVLPPWYRTWVAYGLYALFIGSSAFLFYRFQLRRKLENAENRRLKELDAFKSRFFTNVTHEFRTPLTVILGMTDRLENPQQEALDKEQQATAIQLIRRNGQNLLRLINEILDLAKLENQSLQMHYVQGDVLAYLRYIVESLHSLANVKNVLLRVESQEAKIVMDYDPDRMLQIIYNLLSNAIKFTPGGGKVYLRVNTFGSELRIEVTDTGVGIAPEDLPHVFNRFFQAQHQEHNKAGGTGVGLSLTRELVRAMRGEISVSSMPGKGASFIVRLPISTQANWKEVEKIDWQDRSIPGLTMARPGRRSGANSVHPHLLLIEDNPDVVEYLSGCLQDQYQLDFAYNGRAGIEKALETAPDLIISDVMMPEKDGFEVCDALKNDERSSHIPIILLTARADVESRIAGLRRGADAYLAKPFHPEELRVQLRRLLENQQRLQERYARLALSKEVAAPHPVHAIEDAFLLKLRQYLEANLSNSALSPDDVCRAMGMGRTNLHNKLSALTGKPLTLYLRELRLHFAKGLLLDSPQLNISEVAYASGFDDPKYFSRVFSETFGMSPSALRSN